jgi:hypothetical protein
VRWVTAKSPKQAYEDWSADPADELAEQEENTADDASEGTARARTIHELTIEDIGDPFRIEPVGRQSPYNLSYNAWVRS